MSNVSAFTMETYPHQPAAVYLFLKFANLSFTLEFKSYLTQDASPAKMFHSFTAVEVPMKHTFFAFSHFFLLVHGKVRMLNVFP